MVGKLVVAISVVSVVGRLVVGFVAGWMMLRIEVMGEIDEQLAFGF